MTKVMRTFKQRWILIAMMCFLSLGAVTTAGCAGKTKSTTVTTQTTSAVPSGNTTSVTTHDEVVTDAHPRGIIGGVFYTIGQVIIFPFRVIGNLFS